MMLIRRVNTTGRRALQPGWLRLDALTPESTHHQVGLDLQHCWGIRPGEHHAGFV
jgi:hypothetical protein